jgi:dsRNA-specific ribonuclease
MNDEFGDGARLAELGAQVLQMVVTWSLFTKRPMLQASEIVEQRDEILTDSNIGTWLSAYKLREKVRGTSEAMKTINLPEEGRLLFHTYVGAVYSQYGLTVVQKWIARLIDPDWEPPVLPEWESEVKRPRLDFTPAPPTVAAPPLPSSPSSTTSSYSHTPPPYAAAPSAMPAQGMAFLPTFNQIANQRRLQVDYPGTFSGPPHAGRWHVKCVVNGVVKGEGAAPSKQLAKEEAAKQAYFAMNLGTRPGSMPPPQVGSSPHALNMGSSMPTIKQEDCEMSGTPPPPPPGEGPPPPPPPNGPPPSFGSNYTPSPLAPGGTQYLPLFNQIATQRRLAVDYPAEFSGPPHAGRWLVRCMVNGVQKGQGYGPSKQLAKEEAAREAYSHMGFGQPRF